jgi:hypothetical protein
MSILDKIETPKTQPGIVTIAGDAGVGKTSLAAQWPKPIFIRAEDGMQAIAEEVRPDAFPVLVSVEDLWAQLTALIQEEHEYKTLVLDSVTALETLFITHVVETDPNKPKSINQALGGFGSGMRAVAAMHQRVRKAAGMLRSRGMAVVFLAHTDVETVDPPDGTPYTKMSLRLSNRSQQAYIDDVDLVGLLALETYRKRNEKGADKAFSSGERVLLTTASAAHVSKNRYGITEPMMVPVGINPLAGIVPGA